MKKEDKEIKYRPELSKLLKEHLELALKFYNVNFIKTYYVLMAKLVKEKDPEQY